MKFKRIMTGIIFGLISGGFCAPSSAEVKKNVDPKTALSAKIESYSIVGTVDQAVRGIEKLGGIKCIVDWPALENVGLKRNAQVSVVGEDVKLSQVIDLVLLQLKRHTKNQTPLAWVVRNNAILLTTQDNVLRRQKLSTALAGRLKNVPTTRPAKSRRKPRAVFDFKDKPLSEVIDTFRKITGANFHVNWRALEAVGIDKDTEVSLHATNISTARAMDLIFSDLNATKGKFDSIYWVVDRNVVEISTGEILNRTMRTRLYDVADILHVYEIQRCIASKLSTTGHVKQPSLSDDNDQKNNDEKDEKEKWVFKRTEQYLTLVSIIKNTIGEEMWQPQGKGTIKLHNNRLLITQSLLGFKLMEKSLNK